MIFNPRPYTRKLESGAQRRGRRHVESTKNALARRYAAAGVFDFDMRFLTMPSGIHPDVPYVLRAGTKAQPAKQDRRSKAFREGRSHLSVRSGRQAGDTLTYPSLIIGSHADGLARSL